jgi:transcription elongation factor GreA
MIKSDTSNKDSMKNNNGPRVIQLTQQGMNELKAELQALLEVKIPEVIKRVAVARAHGDLSENAEYQNAREEQQLYEARAAEIEDVISHAKVVQNTRSSTTVGMGTTVKVSIKGKKGKTFTYTVVGEFEANPTEGRISSDSPIGKAFVGSKKGDTVTVQAPAGQVEYVIEELV